MPIHWHHSQVNLVCPIGPFKPGQENFFNVCILFEYLLKHNKTFRFFGDQKMQNLLQQEYVYPR
jgi:hypothetical protein